MIDQNGEKASILRDGESIETKERKKRGDSLEGWAEKRWGNERDQRSEGGSCEVHGEVASR